MKRRLAIAVACLLPTVVATAAMNGTGDSDCPACPRMKVIAAGTFDMGTAASDPLASEDEQPRHRVTIGKSFAVGVHEVTRAQFAAFVEATGYDAGNSCNALENG